MGKPVYASLSELAVPFLHFMKSRDSEVLNVDFSCYYHHCGEVDVLVCMCWAWIGAIASIR